MAFDETLAQRLRQVLAAQPQVTERKMMGALCFMVRGHMCCGVTGSALMVRVGREAQEQTLAERHVKPMVIGNRRTAGFILAEPEALQSDAVLSAWIQRALNVVLALPPKQSDPP